MSTPVVTVETGMPVTVTVTTPNVTNVVSEPTEVQVVNLYTAGPQGPRGNPGIYVAPTPPENPEINDLWLQLPGP